jgi:putative chitobiose transport system substrate-binding protein
MWFERVDIIKRKRAMNLRHLLTNKNISGIRGIISIFLFIAIISIVPFISSCRSGNNLPAGKTKIEFWTLSLKPTYTEYINGIINQYQKKHPDVVVEWIDMPESVIMQKLLASIAGGVPPDVVNLSTSASQLLAQNLALVCMDDAVSQEDKDLYFKNLWDSTSFEGKSYGIPWYVTTRVIMYNTELFKKGGIDPGNPPKTWEEVMEYSKLIRKKTGQFGYIPAIKIFEDFAMQGVPVLSPDGKKPVFNCPEGVSVLRGYLDMKEKDLIPVETLSEGYKGALNRYQSGNLGMVIAGPTLLLKIKADAPEIYKKTKVAPMPVGKAGIVPAAIMNMVVPRGVKDKGRAVDFALFVTNNENQLAFCKLVPLLPSTRASATDEFFKKGKGEQLQDDAIRISLSQLPIARDMSLGIKNAPQLSRIMQECVESAYYGRETPQRALDIAAKRWEEILGQ